GPVELAEDGGGVQGQRGVEGVGAVVPVAAHAPVLTPGGRVPAPAPWSNRSLSASTSAAGGFHDHTPGAVSPTDGTGSTALMPRTKRYSTPPRWVAAS